MNKYILYKLRSIISQESTRISYKMANKCEICIFFNKKYANTENFDSWIENIKPLHTSDI